MAVALAGGQQEYPVHPHFSEFCLPDNLHRERRNLPAAVGLTKQLLQKSDLALYYVGNAEGRTCETSITQLPHSLQEVISTASEAAIDDKPCKYDGRVSFSSQRDAEMVCKALEVDPELRPQLVQRQLSVEGSTLVMSFAAVDVRSLRAAVGSFCDLLILATRTLELFGTSKGQ